MKLTKADSTVYPCHTLPILYIKVYRFPTGWGHGENALTLENTYFWVPCLLIVESASAQTFTYYADEMVWLLYQRHQVQGTSAELSNIILATCTSLSSWCHCQDAKKQTEVFQGTSSFNWGEFKLNTVAGLNLRQGFFFSNYSRDCDGGGAGL